MYLLFQNNHGQSNPQQQVQILYGVAFQFQTITLWFLLEVRYIKDFKINLIEYFFTEQYH